MNNKSLDRSLLIKMKETMRDKDKRDLKFLKKKAEERKAKGFI